MQTTREVQKIAEACPLARRPHLCSVCSQPIAIGSRYDRIVYIDKRNVGAKPTVAKLHRPSCPREILDV
jgi:hypothetical protein